MSFVLKRKADGKYAKGRTRWNAEWVEDIQQARVYPNRGNATHSLNHTFGGAYRNSDEQLAAGFEIVPVKIMERSSFEKMAAAAVNARLQEAGTAEHAG